MQTKDAKHYGHGEGAEQEQTDAAGGSGSASGAAADTIHTLCTGNGSPYQVGAALWGQAWLDILHAVQRLSSRKLSIQHAMLPS